MPDVADMYPKLAELNFDQLNTRRREILGGKTDFNQLELDQLHELSVVAALLRRKASGPPREAKVSKTPVPKSILDLNV